MVRPVSSAETAPSTARRALVIAHEPDGPARQVEVRLRERGFDVHTHVVTPDFNKPNEATPWPDLSEYDIVLPMGSIRSLTRKHEIESWIDDELQLLREAHERNQPMFGICFGGQLLAEALGGSVEEAPVTEIGWYELRAPEGTENPAGPGPWKEWHHDRFTAPPESEVLAETEDAAQLFRIGRTIGTQFHPEVDGAHIADWVSQAGEEYLGSYDKSGPELVELAEMHEEANTKQCHALVDWWLDEVAFPDGLDAEAQQEATV